MGKKKRREDGAEAAPRRIYCYYCDRNFDDEKVLILHQKARHFKCQLCHKKLNTASGMVIHAMQVHKEKLEAVPNAKAGRESVDLEIYGMQGVPGEGGVDDPTKKPRLGVPPMPMGMPMVPGGFPGVRPPPPPMMGMIPPRPPFPIPGQPPGMYPPRPIGVVPGIPGVPGVPGVPPPMWGAAPPGVVPPRPIGGVVTAPPGAPAPGVPPAALAYMNQQLGVAAAIPVPPAVGTPAAVAPPGLVQQVSSSQVLSSTSGDTGAPKSDLGLVYSDNDISMEEKRAMRPKYGYNKPLAAGNS